MSRAKVDLRAALIVGITSALTGEELGENELSQAQAGWVARCAAAVALGVIGEYVVEHLESVADEYRRLGVTRTARVIEKDAAFVADATGAQRARGESDVEPDTERA